VSRFDSVAHDLQPLLDPEGKVFGHRSRATDTSPRRCRSMACRASQPTNSRCASVRRRRGRGLSCCGAGFTPPCSSGGRATLDRTGFTLKAQSSNARRPGAATAPDPFGAPRGAPRPGR
jgi:hypothetical protein